MKRNLTVMVAAGLSFIGLGLSGCGDGDMTGPDVGVESIEITPSTATFASVGSSIQFEAIALGPAGTPVSGADITWSTGGRGVIEVERESGFVTSVGNGTERLVASVGSVSSEVMVSVEQVPVSLGHEVVQVGLGRIGANFTLRPVALDFNGSPITIPSDFTYSSSAPATVGVDVNGILTAYDFGTATITIERMGLQTTVGATVGVITGDGPVLDQPAPCTAGRAGPYECDRIDLVSYLPLAGLGAAPGIEVTDVWGWRDSVTLREYALVGRSDGVVFVDMTQPAHPKSIAFLPGSVPSSSSRAVRVYGGYAYVVAEGALNHGVQVFDLARLRGVETYTIFTEDERYIQVSGARGIAVDEETGFAYVTGADLDSTTCPNGLHMLNLADPARPTFAGCFINPGTGFGGTGFTNAAQCVVYRGPDDYAGREICFSSNETAIAITDVTDKSAPVAISIATPPGAAYVTQGWLSDDHRYFFQSDEGDEIGAADNGPAINTRTFIWDLEDLDDPLFVGVYDGPTFATDFNGFVIGSRLYLANGSFGLRVLDIADPVNPMEAGFFDTYPEHNLPATVGARASYPFFGDGRVLVVSPNEGLFILQLQ